jgi:hypothetical protein
MNFFQFTLYEINVTTQNQQNEMTLEEICNKLQRPINDIIERECNKKVCGLEERLKALNQKQKIEALDNARIETGDELEAMVRQYFKIYDVVEEWQDSKNFMWGGGLMEVLTPDEKRQYMTFPSENCYLEKYEQQPDFYDKELPYLSFIIKEMVLLKFKSTLNNLGDLYLNVIKSRKKELLKVKLSKEQKETLTECFNKTGIFSINITTEIIDDLFSGSLEEPLHSQNTRLLVYFFWQLEINMFVIKNWQAFIYNNKLIIGTEKNKPLNESDLSSAKHECKQKSPIGSETIDKYIEKLNENQTK